MPDGGYVAVVLDQNSVLPLYYQLKEVLREEIEGGAYRPGDLLPSERELCARYGVSRITVRQAVLDLVREGLLERRRGKGTFVRRPKVEDDLLGFYDFTRRMRDKGKEQTVRLLAVETVQSKGAASWLNLEASEPLVRVTRLRIIDGEPLILERAFFPVRYFPGLEKKDFSAAPIYYHLITEEYGFTVVRARKYIEPVLLDRFEAGVLGVKKGAPGLLLVRITYGKGEIPISLNKWLVRGDRCRHYIELSADGTSEQGG
ncbi:MAG: GntR family transcriptional regulator [Bacillota bacterium]|nr:GntR family transcriptional regulator [Bacillota bacterium]